MERRGGVEGLPIRQKESRKCHGDTEGQRNGEESWESVSSDDCEGGGFEQNYSFSSYSESPLLRDSVEPPDTQSSRDSSLATSNCFPLKIRAGRPLVGSPCSEKAVTRTTFVTGGGDVEVGLRRRTR